ncbi:MAG: hypothetical protein P1U86_20275, partial [Verrucomicrobiales bacterium]|nr:hypothetical protein [Verrucomicrobiales bacterium]
EWFVVHDVGKSPGFGLRLRARLGKRKRAEREKWAQKTVTPPLTGTITVRDYPRLSIGRG